MTHERRELIQFFAEHAGYCTPSGRMTCARDLADAYLDAEAEGYTWEWVWDADSDYVDAVGCMLHDPSGNVVSSLWGIVDPDDNYRRVVEAELACEIPDPTFCQL